LGCRKAACTLLSFRPVKSLLTIIALILIERAPLVAAEFALRDGDTVVFLGDSITAARQYTKVIETYALLRFPERRIRFVNAGKGGETAKLSLDRLDQAVFAEGATVVTVAYGVNDIGWGMKADAAHKKGYLDALSELIDRCQKRGIRVFICSAAITAELPDRAENGFLQKMCDEGLALAKSKGAGTIDVQRSMRAVQRRVLEHNAKLSDNRKAAKLHADDSVQSFYRYARRTRLRTARDGYLSGQPSTVGRIAPTGRCSRAGPGGTPARSHTTDPGAVRDQALENA
jgi:hypothetical protein